MKLTVNDNDLYLSRRQSFAFSLESFGTSHC